MVNIQYCKKTHTGSDQRHILLSFFDSASDVAQGRVHQYKHTVVFPHTFSHFQISELKASVSQKQYLLINSSSWIFLLWICLSTFRALGNTWHSQEPELREPLDPELYQRGNVWVLSKKESLFFGYKEVSKTLDPIADFLMNKQSILFHFRDVSDGISCNYPVPLRLMQSYEFKL